MNRFFFTLFTFYHVEVVFYLSQKVDIFKICINVLYYEEVENYTSCYQRDFLYILFN